ncbi:redox-regulated ATPase YchF [Candidatus Gottesmanbacteria bacterium RIFOXYB1_FULL_47_11]|uniref:Ribosome-binding ATPase YchF n=1 Tax=Candidatus Gottesmanbacteria bacterium RIFOXYB1_FULL_47_11 TaxID=1798401 RepID=A0A1F6BD32_9BACT|nr:MAG: redox-regulated ATPase YchF [Candidatus Gottesmanbacteria bacterium RIFOXYB1_FULL_47_11]
MNLKIGIVGLANVGKSTLFNALLKKQQALAANYPFATIEPNIGVVPVPDFRLQKLAEVTRTEEKMDKLPPIKPATVEFVDIAGLVKGAAEGEGLGNKFLSHVREMDIICHVVRFFPDPNIVHVAGAVDPVRDREIVETELALADLQTLAKQAEPKQTATKEERVRWGVIEKLKEGLNNGKLARDVITDPGLRSAIHDLQLLTMKPMMYVANVAENQLNEKNAMLAICAETESQLAGLSEAEQKEYLKSLGLEKSGLDRLIQKAYEMLGLISFLTTGVIESRAWTIENGMKAPTAAGVIHTDFEKKFIKADCVAFDDFIALGGWKTSREEGKVRSEGKEYVMRDGDVVEFKVGT